MRNFVEVDHEGFLVTYDSVDVWEIREFIAGSKKNIVGVVNESLNFNYDIQEQTEIWTVPIAFEAELPRILRSARCPDNTTEKCFNFNINKKQINRYYLMKFIEWFDLKSFYYTNSGIGNQFDLSDELNDINLLVNTISDGIRLKTCVLAPSNLAVNWFGEGENNGSNIPNYGDNPPVFTNFIEPLMTKTAVALITEAAPTHDRCCHFTEKTAFCLASKNFPIWIGGFGCADTMRDMGLDVFDDVIDHSYQYKPTLVERCYWAFANNLELLTDLTYAHSQRVKHSGRLQRNFDQCVPLVTQFVDKQLRSMPDAPRKILQQIRKTIWHRLK